MSRYQHAGRTEQAKAALQRQADANALRKKGRWRGAMYLLGYVVECKLKARLMEMYDVSTLSALEEELTRRFKGQLSQDVDFKTHSIEYLFRFTNARDRLIASNGDESCLRAYRQCCAWSTSWRYDPRIGDENKCSLFFDSVGAFCRFITHSV